MKLIAAASENWGIGFNGDVLFKIPRDREFFREKTMGKSIIMGRKTFESLPKALTGRRNIVLTRNPRFSASGAIVCGDAPTLLELLENDAEEAFVIGGGEIYRFLLPYCRRAYITRITRKPAADTFMPELDRLPEWSETERSDIFRHNGVNYFFSVYEKNN